MKDSPLFCISNLIMDIDLLSNNRCLINRMNNCLGNANCSVYFSNLYGCSIRKS